MRYEDLFCGLVEDFVYVQKIYFCEECNMIYTKNPISTEIFDRHYKRMSRYESTEYVGKEDYSLHTMYERQFDFINQNIEDYESVLEIGASTGESLSMYKKIGKRVKGIEPSVRNKEFCNSRYGIELVDKTFDEWERDAKEESYDLFFMSHVLEHIVDFRSTIERINRFNPKYFFIEVPCIESKGDGLEPFGMITPEHVNLFSKDSLCRLMSENGYALLKCDFPSNDDGTAPQYPTIMTLWSKTDKKEPIFSKTINPGLELKNYYNKTSSEFDKGVRSIINGIDSNVKLAVWGTGIHTARLLGMTDLMKKNIVKFYDSDYRRYGMTILGKPIEPFSEDDIKNRVVDMILISSYASKNAIKKTIIEKCGNMKVHLIELYV